MVGEEPLVHQMPRSEPAPLKVLPVMLGEELSQ